MNTEKPRGTTIVKSVKLSVVGGLLHVAALLLDSLEEPKPDADAPITDGDPGGRYLPAFTGPYLRVIPGGEQ